MKILTVAFMLLFNYLHFTAHCIPIHCKFITMSTYLVSTHQSKWCVLLLDLCLADCEALMWKDSSLPKAFARSACARHWIVSKCFWNTHLNFIQRPASIYCMIVHKNNSYWENLGWMTMQDFRHLFEEPTTWVQIS